MKKYSYVVLFFLLVTFIDMKGNFAQENSKQKNAIDFNDSRFIIYYLPLSLFVNGPLKNSDLIEGFYFYKIIVENHALKDYLDILEKINGKEYEFIEDKSFIDVRIYCEFQRENGEKVFSFSLCGANQKMLINGKRIKNDLLFYELVQGFLPKKELSGYNKVLEYIKNEE